MTPEHWNLRVTKHHFAKKITLKVGVKGVRVTVPPRTPLSVGKAFALSKAEWVEQQLAAIKNKGLQTGGSAPSAAQKRTARKLVEQRLEFWNQFYDLDWSGVSIRNQSPRWGSCSSNSHLSFNWRIIELPPHLQDYIIVHEICHLKHMNHSKQFWDEMARTIVDYNDRRADLKAYELGQDDL